MKILRNFRIKLLCLVTDRDLALAYRLCPLQDLVIDRILNSMAKYSDGIDGKSENSKRESEHLERQAEKT